MTLGDIDVKSGKLKKIYYDIPMIATWKSMTRLVLKHHPIQELLSHLDKLISEAADEQWFEKKYPRGFFKEDFKYPKRKSAIKLNLRNTKINKIINDNLKITDIAESYGLIIKKSKAICPFHADSDPSLSFSNKKNVFNCFGCHVKGDLITFIKMMEEKQRDDEKEREEDNEKGS